MKRTLACDIEIFANYFLIAFMDAATGEIRRFELSDRTPALDVERIQTILRSCRIVTFNGQTFDIPLIFLALNGGSVADLKKAANRIIKEGLKWWDVGRELGVYIPDWLDHIDLIEPNPAVMQGLKVLNGRLHGPRMQDLPYHHDAVLTHEQMDVVADYCGNDLDATVRLFKALEEPIVMREDVGRQYGLGDVRSKSDAQLGEAIIKRRVEEITGQRPRRESVEPGTTFQYQVPDFIRFESDTMRAVLDDVRATTFRVKKDGRVDMPKALDGRYIKFGASTYKMGIGGLHSTESNRAIHAGDDHDLVDADVASQYPSIILKLGLVPKSLGPSFLEAYGGIYNERLAAKRAKDAVRDKGGKIALNGCYGKLGSKWSVLHAPHLLIAVTLTGQLTLLMLVERAEMAGIPVVSGNTDGVVFRCPKNKRAMLDEICEAWQDETGFKLEFAEYRSIYNLSVNTYFAIKADGSVKRKGTVSNPWAEGDLRAQMMKNPNMTICSDAALAWITDGIDPSVTIRGTRDIRGFVTVVNVKGGGVWVHKPQTETRGMVDHHGWPIYEDGRRLTFEKIVGLGDTCEYIGKVVRYAWCKGGSPIFYKEPHPTTGNFKKVSRTDGCRPMMNLPDEFPDDIDYDRYIAEAWDILRQVGAIGPANDNDWSRLQAAFGVL